MTGVLERIEIGLLMRITAKAFGEKPVRLPMHPRGAALETYAESTRRWMEGSETPADQLQADMHREALKMGRRIRRLLFFLNGNGRAKAVFWLYRGIGIDMAGSLPGEVTVRSCFFSRYYTPEMCRLISAMDDGIVSGIMGGGAFRFSQQITEGCGSCRACLTGRNSHGQ